MAETEKKTVQLHDVSYTNRANRQMTVLRHRFAAAAAAAAMPRTVPGYCSCVTRADDDTTMMIGEQT